MWLPFPIQQPCAAQGICILITVSIEGAAMCNGSFRWGWCTPAPGWETYLTGLHLKRGSDIIINNSKAGKNKDRPDPKRPCPFPTLTICSCQFVTLSCVSPHPSLPTKPKIRPGWHTSLGYLISAASPFQLEEPEILKGDQLLLQQFPTPADFSIQDHLGFEGLWQLTFILLYHTEANSSFTDAEECWSWDIFRCHNVSNKYDFLELCRELRFCFQRQAIILHCNSCWSQIYVPFWDQPSSKFCARGTQSYSFHPMPLMIRHLSTDKNYIMLVWKKRHLSG